MARFAALAGIVALSVVALLAGGAPAGAAPGCTAWDMRTIKSGLGSLENVLPDGMGGLLISASSQNAIVRMTPDGNYSLFVANVNGPGGMRIKNDTLYFNTGNGLQSGAENTPDGTIDRVDLMDGTRQTFAKDLSCPTGWPSCRTATS